MRKLASLTLLTGAGYWLFARPHMLKWGTRLGESQRRLPGDDVVPAPNQQITQAVDIDAPPEAVWPWLAQMGRERTGWYGIDLLGNQGVPSARYLRSDLEAPQVGMVTDGGYEILQLDPPRLIVFGGYDLALVPGVNGDLSLAYLLEPHGAQTRLIVRMRLFAYGVVGKWLTKLLFEWVDALELHQQLQGLRARAEATERQIEIT
ncbi:MAG: hypothetical protein Kow00120_21130 [Anaerolineae bacterium]